MKKTVLACLTFMLCCFALTAKPKIRAVEISTTAQGVDKSQFNAINGIQADLASNLSKYTDLELINSTNQIELRKAGARNEDLIEAGKLHGASHIIFLDVTKIKSKYSLTLRFTDIQTGQDVATIKSRELKSDITDFYDGVGSDVDYMTIELCEKLGIQLSDLEKQILMKGEYGLSNEEKERLYKSDIKAYNNKINELKRQLKSIKSNSLEDKAKKAQLEASIAENEMLLRTASANQKRLEEQKKKKDLDDKKNKERSEEKLEKINSLTGNINSQIAELRAKQKEGLSLLKTVGFTESKKETYLKNKAQFKIDLEEMDQQIEKKKTEVIAEIDAKEWRRADLANGKPTPIALENRQTEKDEALKKIREEDVKERDDYENKILNELKALYDEIQHDYDTIKPRSISTLSDQLIITYEEYDSVNCGWPINIAVQIDGDLLLETTSFLPYTKATGKKVENKLDPRRPELNADYNDTVDIYESLFSNGRELFTYSLNYTIKPMGINYPSKYYISFNNFQFYETKNVEVDKDRIISRPKGTLALEETTAYKQYLPIYEIRTEEQIRVFEEQEKAKEEQRIKAEKDKKRKEKQAEENRKRREREEKEAQERREREAVEAKERQERLAIEKEEEAERRKQEREEKQEEMKENFSAMMDNTKETFNDAFSYHKSTPDTNLIDFRFYTLGGNVNGVGFDLGYNYALSERFYLAYDMRFIFSQNSKYYGLDMIGDELNKGTVWSHLIQFGYTHDLSDFCMELGLSDSFMSYPTWYTEGGMGFSVCFPTVTEASGNFLMNIETGLESKILDMFTVSSGFGFDIAFGKQKTTGQVGYFGVIWNLGVGYRF